MRHLKALVCSSLFCGVLVATPAGALSQELTANEIVTHMLQHNAQRQAMLQHYVSDRSYSLEYSGAAGEHHAEMAVHAEYIAPGRKRLTITSETGSKVLCREVLRTLVQGEEQTAARQDWQQGYFSPANYDLQLLGREQFDGVSAWVLQVEPKHPDRVAYRGKVWISTGDFAMMRVQGEPAKNPSWMVDHAQFDTRYMRLGEIWVPKTNVSTTHVRLGGTASVTINYGIYPVLSTTPLIATESVPADASQRPSSTILKKTVAHALR